MLLRRSSSFGHLPWPSFDTSHFHCQKPESRRERAAADAGTVWKNLMDGTSRQLVHAIPKVCRILPSITMLLRLWTHFHKTPVSYKILNNGWIALDNTESPLSFSSPIPVSVAVVTVLFPSLSNPSRYSFNGCENLKIQSLVTNLLNTRSLWLPSVASLWPLYLMGLWEDSRCWRCE